MEKGLYKGCPVQFAMQFLRGKWQIAILWNLRERPERFSDLKQMLPGIKDKVLMNELTVFTSNGMIDKKIFDNCFPPRTEYAITEKGRTLLPVIQHIVSWGYEHLQDVKMNDKMFLTPTDIIDDLILALPDPKG